ncbi:oxygenase MpaB family protein [uncultured Nocardioides sp.]|uniref:oxygenase MpaB family protein n=1 Tax=uncultured Nocardioides sp. TaxID=198441 RepID=UPI0025D7B45A|nr:oxygenase MpaB family protein [uncultured Nocardioides sp.]
MSYVDDVRGRLGHALFLRVAGPDGVEHRDRIHGTPGPRWFEPGSPITRVHADASMFIGGLRALLLQTLHPAAMQAVADHSGYRGDMWGRLARTSTFLATTTFGTAADAQQAVEVVKAIHRRVTGEMPDGTPYAASDPHLLLWVHVAEVESFLLAHSTYGSEPLDQACRDEYVAQQGEVARRLGVPDPPVNEAQLNEAVKAFRPELRGTPAAREAVGHVLFRPPLPLLARPPYAALAAAAVGLLPPWTRLPLWLPPAVPVADLLVSRALGTVSTSAIRWALPSDVPQPAA